MQLSFTGTEGRVVVEALDQEGRYRNHLSLRAHVAGPHGQTEELALTQTGPGRYEAAFKPGAPGAYLATTSADERLLGTSGAVLTAADELRGVGTDNALLAQIAALTGGRVHARLVDAVHARPAPHVAYDPVWEWALRLALLSMLMSVAGRRLVLPRLRRAPRARQPSADPESPASTAALLLAQRRSARQADGEAVPPAGGEADAWERELAVLASAPARARPEGAAEAPTTEAPTAAPSPPPEPPTATATTAPVGASLAERLLAKKNRDGGTP